MEEDEDKSDKDMIEIGMKGLIRGKNTKCALDANVAKTKTCCSNVRPLKFTLREPTQRIGACDTLQTHWRLPHPSQYFIKWSNSVTNMSKNYTTGWAFWHFGHAISYLTRCIWGKKSENMGELRASFWLVWPIWVNFSNRSNIVSNHSNQIFRNIFGATHCILLRVVHKPHIVSVHEDFWHTTRCARKFSVTGAKTAP